MTAVIQKANDGRSLKRIAPTTAVASGSTPRTIPPCAEGSVFIEIETNNGKIINLPSIRVPFARGRRVFLNQRLLKNILIALDPDEIEVIDQRYLNRIKTWAINRNVRVRTENMPIDFLELKNKFQINTDEMETKIRNGLRQFSIPA